MGECVKIRRKLKRVCIGSLNHKITITIRGIKVPEGDDPNFSEEFTEDRGVWSMIETINPKVFFDQTNTEQVKTHYFTIRKPAGNVNVVNWITYQDINYNVLAVENINEDNRFLKISANVRGDASIPVNEA